MARVLRANANSILLCLFELAVGILLLINPVSFTTGIIVVAGVVLLVMGLVNIIKYFRAEAGEAALSQKLVKGLVALVAGAFCIFKSGWFLATFPVLTILYGVVILVAGIGKIQMMVDMLRLKQEKWFVAAISALVSIVCAVVIISSPFTSTAILWAFTGVSLIVEAVLDVVTLIMRASSDEQAAA